MLDYLMLVILLALATSGCALMARALPWPKGWTDVKPLACPVCMSGWSAFAVMTWTRNDLLSGWSFMYASIAWLICVAISSMIFLHVYPPPLEFPPES